MDEWRRDEMEGLHARIAHRFGRAETRERAKRYLAGLVEGGEGRRSGRRMAERMGEAGPDGAQRLLNSARWDADGVRDDLRGYVVENLADPGGGLVLVEAGFPKKGAGSAGVARQLDPSTGRVQNCQLALFLAYASPRGRAFVDRELYLPKEWTEDAERRRKAGVPDEVRYATRGELARRMMERAIGAGVRAGWVSGGDPYGDDEELRGWLQSRELPYALVRRFRGPENAVGVPRRPPREIRKNVATWTPLQGGTGSWEGRRTYGWRYISQDEEAASAQEQWLVLRRWTDASRREKAYYRACRFGRAPSGLAAAAATHEAVEGDLERARGAVGLGEHEARGWNAWYRHATLCLLAHDASQVARAE
ncbi:MAG: IS701 family transposase [Actinomycetota bacterium]|nr:IS701 family transposase [Actinomycetota bacterium]